MWCESDAFVAASHRLQSARLGRIEIQVRSNLDRDKFLALYLVRRTNFWVSLLQKILFAYTTDTFWGSFRYRTCIWFWFADPQFVVRSQPCQSVIQIDRGRGAQGTTPNDVPVASAFGSAGSLALEMDLKSNSNGPKTFVTNR